MSHRRLAVFVCAAVALAVGGFAAAQPRGENFESLQRFADSPALSRALDRTLADPALHERVMANPQALLRMARLSVPEGLEVQTFEPGRLFEEPLPRIELTRCRRVYYCEYDDRQLDPDNNIPVCQLKESELCLGFRVIDRRPPPGFFPPIR
ncbi:MAG: hypothetical protein K2P58_14070 [Hyphomonadaceae bacterium]|nr:hypothetical protein [Hyphomonadaceae bacterium]